MIYVVIFYPFTSTLRFRVRCAKPANINMLPNTMIPMKGMVANPYTRIGESVHAGMSPP